MLNRINDQFSSMSWSKIFIFSAILALPFFWYFAYVVGDKITIWAIQLVSPSLQVLRYSYGQDFALVTGHLVAFLAGALATAAFLMPISWAIRAPIKVLASSILIIAPVLLVTLASTRVNLYSIAILLQPVAGVALIFKARSIASFSSVKIIQQ